MGDILGAIFGTSAATEQQTTPDPVTQALNMLRLNQAVNLFSPDRPLWQFAGEQPGIYTPTDFSTDLASIARSEALSPRTNLDFVSIPTLDQYLRSFDPITGTYNAALGRLDTSTLAALQDAERMGTSTYNDIQARKAEALQRSYGDYGIGTTGARDAYGTTIASLRDAYNQAIARGDYDYARALAQSEQNRATALGTLGNTFTGSLGLEELGRQRALDLGTNAIGGYMSRIATPAINRAMTLQGLEYGGAVPQALATATAEQAIPYLQSIEQLYGTNVANLIAQYIQQQTGINTATQALQADIGTKQAATGAQLGGQRMAGETAAGNALQGNITQLAQALMANNISLEQAGIAANSQLGQQLIQVQNALRLQQQQAGVSLASMYTPLQASFTQSIPGVGTALAALPGQLSSQRVANLNAMVPLSDMPRQLAEQDFLRRQGLFQTVYTGIPYQPGSTTSQQSGTGNIFNQLGGLLASAGTFGMKGGSGQGIA